MEGYKSQAPGTHGKETKRVVRRTQGSGCAAGGFPSGLGWEVRLSCFYVVAGLDWYGQGIELSL